MAEEEEKQAPSLGENSSGFRLNDAPAASAQKTGSTDDNFDQKPGNDRNSEGYARIYDRDSGTEYNQLEDREQNEARVAALKAAQQHQRDLELQFGAQQGVQFLPGIGKFIIPSENTFAAHCELTCHDGSDMMFSPSKYVYFDKIIAEEFGNPALTDKNHPDYAEMEGLRKNLAVLRNVIFIQTFDDGSFDAGDETEIPRLQSIAKFIGKGLKNDHALRRVFSSSINMELAKHEGLGAQEIYEYLLKHQEPTRTFTPLINAVNDMIGIPNRDWQLVPVENTPFTAERLLASPPERSVTLTESEIKERCADPHMQQTLKEEGLVAADTSIAEGAAAASLGEQLAAISEKIARTAKRFRSVDEMEIEAREESVELAREILRRLRDMKFDDRSTEEFLDMGRPEDKLNNVRKVAQIIEIYEQYLAKATANNPDILNDPLIQEANDAVGSFAYGIKLMAAKEMPGSVAAAQQISAEATQMPEKWKNLKDRTVDRLLASIEQGMEQAVASINQQQQEAAEQSQEMAEAAAETAALQSQQASSKRRKRRGFAALAKMVRRTNAGDKDGDGVRDEFQGKSGRSNVVNSSEKLAGADKKDVDNKTSKDGKDGLDKNSLRVGDGLALQNAGLGAMLGGSKPTKTGADLGKNVDPNALQAAKAAALSLLRQGEAGQQLAANMVSVAPGETVSADPNQKSFAVDKALNHVRDTNEIGRG